MGLTSIANLRVLAKEPDTSLPHKEFTLKNALAQTAQAQIQAYEEYKLLLEKESIFLLRRAMKRLAYKPAHTMICLHGDIENVHVQYRGKWCEDNFGKVHDQESDETAQMWCSGHDSERLHCAHTIVDEVDGIAEFAEVVKILKKITG